MRTANLYVRVSTDEQAERGFSQRNQEEVLRRYCEIKSIQVGKVYYEDHSAKTFNRPVWSKLLVDLRKEKGRTDLVLFTKWDRFSRNTGDAYYMINLLNRFGVEPQAIEQPLDLSVPENKMMLAFYLAAPEVENERRSLNIFHGTRRAKKEGRWVTTAPLGYANLAHDNGKKYIAPQEPYATIMREAFMDIAEGKFNLMQVFQQAKAKGLPCTYKNFWHIIRNPVYCGKIVIHKYKDEEGYLADGQHEALISETIFYQAHEILNGRKKRKPTRIVCMDHLPLRGFLICPKCGNTLTGSASKGRKKHYYYYHCFSKCDCRFKADHVNAFFENEFAKLKIREGYEPFYHHILADTFKLKSNSGEHSRKQVMDEIKVLNGKIDQARDLLLSGDFSGTDFQQVKTKCETEIVSLEKRLPDIITTSKMVDQMLIGCLSNLKALSINYKDADIEQKRRVIGSMYPENATFDGYLLRTTRTNEIACNIALINKQLDKKKNGQVGNYPTCPIG